MSLPDRAARWIQDNTAAAAVLGITLLGLGLLVAALGGGGLQTFSGAQEQAALDRSAEFDAATRDGGDGGGESGSGAFVEVQEADFDIETDDAEQAADAVRGTATGMAGYVEESRKSDTSLHTTIRLTVRVPEENFERFNERLREQYTVESYNVRNYRISIQRQVDELTVINRSLQAYEEMRGEVRRMEMGEERIDLLMRITEKELELHERQKRYLRQLSSAQQRSDMATVNVELRERKDVDLTPDNVWNRFKEAVRDMLDSITEIAINTVTGGITLFFRVLQLIVYAVIVLVPLGLAYRVGRRLYREYWPEVGGSTGNGDGR